MQKNSHSVSSKMYFSARKAKLTTTLLLLASIFFITPAFAGKAAPGLTLKKLDNSSFKISDYKGDVVYVDFWATWCPPCRKSFPWMEEMNLRYKDLGFQIVAISLDTKRSVIDQFLEKMDTSFVIAHDPSGESATAFKVKGMPSSYLIDRKGNIHLTHLGFNAKDKSKLEDEIKSLIASD